MITLGIFLTILGGGISMIAGLVSGKEKDDRMARTIEEKVNERISDLLDRD